MKPETLSYHGYRFPPEIICHAVWLYHRAPQQAVALVHESSVRFRRRQTKLDG